MIRRAVGTIAVALLFALGVPAFASAHVLEIDGNIGAVLHINPDDSPVTGTSTDYVLTFDDYSGRFSLPQCNCQVSVIANGQTITTLPLAITSAQVSENHYTFANSAVYDLRVSGMPKTAGAFQPFTLNYEVKVGQVNRQGVPALLWAGMALGIGLVLLGAFSMEYTTKEPRVKDYQ